MSKRGSREAGQVALCALFGKRRCDALILAQRRGALCEAWGVELELTKLTKHGRLASCASRLWRKQPTSRTVKPRTNNIKRDFSFIFVYSAT